MRPQSFCGKGPRPLEYAGPRAARGKEAIIGTHNCLNYCVVFMAHTQFAVWPRAT